MTESTLNPSRMIINSIPGLITIIIGQCRELVPKEVVFNPSRLIQKSSIQVGLSSYILFKHSTLLKPNLKTNFKKWRCNYNIELVSKT